MTIVSAKTAKEVSTRNKKDFEHSLRLTANYRSSYEQIQTGIEDAMDRGLFYYSFPYGRSAEFDLIKKDLHILGYALFVEGSEYRVSWD